MDRSDGIDLDSRSVKTFKLINLRKGERENGYLKKH
jgi:hypothetical protein